MKNSLVFLICGFAFGFFCKGTPIIATYDDLSPGPITADYNGLRYNANLNVIAPVTEDILLIQVGIIPTSGKNVLLGPIAEGFTTNAIRIHRGSGTNSIQADAFNFACVVLPLLVDVLSDNIVATPVACDIQVVGRSVTGDIKTDPIHYEPNGGKMQYYSINDPGFTSGRSGIEFKKAAGTIGGYQIVIDNFKYTTT